MAGGGDSAGGGVEALFGEAGLNGLPVEESDRWIRPRK